MPLKSRQSGSECRFLFFCFFCTNTEIQTSRRICLSVFLLSYVSCLTSQRRQQTGNSRKQHGGKRQCYRVNFWCLYFSLPFKLTTDWVIFKCSLFGIRQQTLHPHVHRAIALETGQKRSVSALFHPLDKLPTCSQTPVVSHEFKKKNKKTPTNVKEAFHQDQMPFDCLNCPPFSVCTDYLFILPVWRVSAHD